MINLGRIQKIARLAKYKSKPSPESIIDDMIQKDTAYGMEKSMNPIDELERFAKGEDTEEQEETNEEPEVDEAEQEAIDEEKKDEAQKSMTGIEELEAFAKGGPYIGPKGGKWADAAHKIPWKDKKVESTATSSKDKSKENKHKEDMSKFEGFKKVNSGFYTEGKEYYETYAKYPNGPYEDGIEYDIVQEKNGKQTLLDEDGRHYTEDEDLEGDIIHVLRGNKLKTDTKKSMPQSLDPMQKSTMSPQDQRDAVARDTAIMAYKLRKGEDDVVVGVGIAPPKAEPEVMEKGRSWVQGEGAMVHYSDHSDRAAAALVKSDSFYTNGSPTMGTRPMICQTIQCSACKSMMSKSLTACPVCGDGAVHRSVVSVESPDESTCLTKSMNSGPRLMPRMQVDLDLSNGWNPVSDDE